MLDTIWYKNAVIYCLGVDSFQDGNGDGIGDFRGLINRLDYLHGLGIDAVWLMPFMPSPRRGHGYDVVEYYGVDPKFGTLGDFSEFVHGCSQRGIRVMMDMVLNHTSDQHPWFQSARIDRASPYRDWYLWSDKEPKNRHKGMVFPGSQDAVWDYDAVAGAWYFHRFFKFQPDLNIAHPAVREELCRILGFWLDLGVSGFRLDAVPFVIDTDEHLAGNDDREYALLRVIRAFTQFRAGDSVLLAEANVPADHSMRYFGADGDRLNMMFNFPVNAANFYAMASGDEKPLRKALHATRARPETAQWCQFLRNHDELDLSILTRKQRDSVYAAFAPDDDMRLYDRGIRRRIAPMLGNDRRRMELATSVLFGLPGTPVLRYGDEIGMGEDLSLPERDAVRTPMQWSPDAQGGFTSANEIDNPVIDDERYGFARVNVEDQRRDRGSFLNWTAEVIRLRRETPEIGYGDFELLKAARGVLAIRYIQQDRSVVVAYNFTDAVTSFQFAAHATGGRIVDLLSSDGNRRPGLDIDLAPYGYHWLRISVPIDK